MRALRILLAAILLLGGIVPAWAQLPGTQVVTVSTSAVGLSAATLTNAQNQQATACLLSVETDAIRLRYDGTNPTSSVGHPFSAGATFPLTGNGNLRELRMIRSGSSDATVTVTCSYGPTEAPIGASASGSGTGSGGDLTPSMYVDDADFTNDSSRGLLGFGLYQSSPQTITDGDVGPYLVDANGRMQIGGTVVVSSGSVVGDTELPSAGLLANDLAIPTTPLIGAVLMCATAGVDVDFCVSGDKTEDVAESGADTGPLMLGVRRDAAASSAGASGDFATLNFDALGQAWTRQLDPCTGVAKTFIPIDIVTATTTELTAALAGASTNYYVCQLNLVSAGANNVALVDDDTDNCASVTSGLAGGTTAAEGWNFAANGGISVGNGNSSVFKTNGANRVMCMVTSAAVQLSGTMAVVAAP